MVSNIHRDPFYSEEEMDSAIVRIPLIRENINYQEVLEQGGCDIEVVYGAPNNYESWRRFMGAQSDILHNHNFGNDLPEVAVVPRKEQEAVDEELIQDLEDLGVDVQESYRRLETTSDDVEAMLEIAGEGDIIHGHTSGYHGIKCDMVGRRAFKDFQDSSYRTFAFETDIGRRKNLLKHNMVIQTVDTVRQLYEISKKEADY